MSALLVVVIAAHAIGILALLRAIVRALREPLSVLARRTIPIGQLQGGLVEVQGSVRSAGELIDAPSGRKGVAVLVTVESRSADNKKRWLSKGEASRSVPFEVFDASGSCVVRAGELRVRAPGLESEMTIGGLRETAPAWVQELAHPKASWVTVREYLIRPGDAVLVHGLAAKREETPGEGYRDGRQKGWRLSPPQQGELLIAEGTQTRLVMRGVVGPVLATIALAGMVACIWLGLRVLMS